MAHTETEMAFPPLPESIESLCLRCPLTDCNERAVGCLIRQTVEADPKLKSYTTYLKWKLKPGNREKRLQSQREHYERRRRTRLNRSS